MPGFINAEGLFNGDRLRRCSNMAQLHFPRLFLASDGFGRLELNYARIVGVAYPTFHPIPSETELQAWIQEYIKTSSLFVFEVDGQLWGQWDTKPEFLPRYKTSVDKHSPIPPESAFTDWKRRYRAECKAFPKSFRNISDGFLLEESCVELSREKQRPSDDAHVGDHLDRKTATLGDLPYEADGVEGSSNHPLPPPSPSPPPPPPTAAAPGRAPELAARQRAWFREFWSEYWRRCSKKTAEKAFRQHVKTEEQFRVVMAAIRAQSPEMLRREESKRPYAATWLNGERWEDELQPLASAPGQSEPPRVVL
jgi:hypothetical protein